MNAPICITTRYAFQARQVEHTLRKGHPQCKAERDGRNVTPQAPSTTDTWYIAQDSRWIVVAS